MIDGARLLLFGEPRDPLLDLRGLLGAAVAHATQDRPALNLSGGVDSATLLALAPPATRAYTLVGDAADDGELDRARRVASLFGATHTVISVDESTFPDHFPAAVRAAGTLLYNGRAVANHLFYLRLRDLGERSLVSGVGADEVFSDDPPPTFAAEWTLARTLRRVPVPSPVPAPAFFDSLRESTLPITTTMAASAGIDVRLPYLDPSLTRFAARLPPALRANKSLLRAVAPSLPDDVRLRPKTRRYAPQGGPRWRALYDEWLTPARIAAIPELDAAAVDALRTRTHTGPDAVADRVLLMLTSLVSLCAS